MALHVDARTASEKAKTRLFEAGVTVMSLGLGEITLANLEEARFRMLLADALYGPCDFKPEELVGVKINGTSIPFRQWIGRIHDQRVRRAKAGRHACR